MKKHGIVPQGSFSKSGLVLSPDGSGYAVDWTELPASDHFFLATSCHLKKDPTGLRILFGSASSFEEDTEHYDLAVEIHFPIHEAALYLHRNVFIEMGGNGKSTFYDSVKDGLSKFNFNTSMHNAEKIKKLPTNKNTSFRMFPANFAAMSFSGTQALIEFFEVTPDLAHFVMNRKNLRPLAGVKPVVSIILDTVTLFHFMNGCRQLIGKNISQEANL